jgi:hypothetical protein
METANSTMLKPAMPLRRVRERAGLLHKVVSSFKGRTSNPAYQGGKEINYDAVAMPGTAGRNSC